MSTPSPRSKSARGTRMLGSSCKSPSHQRAEMEYAIVKSIVEAYCQQRMPARFNKIPVRADKWTTGTVARLDLSPSAMAAAWMARPMGGRNTTTWMARPMGGQNTATWKPRPVGEQMTTWRARPMGDQNAAKGSAKASKVGTSANATHNANENLPSFSKGHPTQNNPSLEELRPQSVRSVFHRNSTTTEKVLPVWSPELKGDIIVSQRHQPVRVQRPMSASADSIHLLQRRGAPSSMLVGMGAIHSPLFLSPRAASPLPYHERPKTVGSLPSTVTGKDEKRRATTDDEGLSQRPDGSNSNSSSSRQGQEGLTQATHGERLLSLDVFLPRESEFSPFGHPSQPQTSAQPPGSQPKTSTTTSGSQTQTSPHPPDSQPKTSTPASDNSRKENAQQNGRQTTRQRAMTAPYGHHLLSESGGTQANHSKNGQPTYYGGGVPSLVTCKRFHDNESGEKIEQNPFRSSCKKWIHCELFGPTLCSDCRIQQEKRFLRKETSSNSKYRPLASSPSLSVQTQELKPTFLRQF